VLDEFTVFLLFFFVRPDEIMRLMYCFNNVCELAESAMRVHVSSFGNVTGVDSATLRYPRTARLRTVVV
jgi:hypothetical protein